MPIVRSKCGYEILVIPDLKAMNTVINKHISKHKKAQYYLEGLTESLSKHVLIVASKITLPITS